MIWMSVCFTVTNHKLHSLPHCLTAPQHSAAARLSQRHGLTSRTFRSLYEYVQRSSGLLETAIRDARRTESPPNKYLFSSFENIAIATLLRNGNKISKNTAVTQ
jgi:hypothetical protein